MTIVRPSVKVRDEVRDVSTRRKNRVNHEMCILREPCLWFLKVEFVMIQFEVKIVLGKKNTLFYVFSKMNCNINWKHQINYCIFQFFIFRAGDNLILCYFTWSCTTPGHRHCPNKSQHTNRACHGWSGFKKTYSMCNGALYVSRVSMRRFGLFLGQCGSSRIGSKCCRPYLTSSSDNALNVVFFRSFRWSCVRIFTTNHQPTLNLLLFLHIVFVTNYI